LPSVPPGSGGKATLTSIGTPSKVGTVLRGALLPHSRTPSPATLQVTAPPNTLGIAAWALGTSASAPTTTDSNTTFRIKDSLSLDFPEP
jgi:hypothetical protein